VSIERRIEALERSYQRSSASEEDPASGAVARRRAEFATSLDRGEAKAAAEEAEGDPRRRIALEDLKETMKERARRRTGEEGSRSWGA
jgi:hypothetical protein